jgi:hypothetical protein
MDIKHASACALEFFSFFLSFFLSSLSLNKQPLKVSRGYMFQASKLNRKYNFEDCATQVNSSEEKIWFT